MFRQSHSQNTMSINNVNNISMSDNICEVFKQWYDFQVDYWHSQELIVRRNSIPISPVGCPGRKCLVATSILMDLCCRWNKQHRLWHQLLVLIRCIWGMIILDWRLRILIMWLTGRQTLFIWMVINIMWSKSAVRMYKSLFLFKETYLWFICDFANFCNKRLPSQCQICM